MHKNVLFLLINSDCFFDNYGKLCIPIEKFDLERNLSLLFFSVTLKK